MGTGDEPDRQMARMKIEKGGTDGRHEDLACDRCSGTKPGSSRTAAPRRPSRRAGRPQGTRRRRLRWTTDGGGEERTACVIAACGRRIDGAGGVGLWEEPAKMERTGRGQRGRSRTSAGIGVCSPSFGDWECDGSAKIWPRTPSGLGTRIVWESVWATVGVAFFCSLPKTDFWELILGTLGDASRN